MAREGLGREAGLWLRLLGFALIPLTVQLFQPAVGAALGILTPLPLAYGMARRGLLEGTCAVALVALLTGALVGTAQGVYFLVETWPLCLGIGWVARSEVPMHRRVLAAVGLVVAAAFAVAAVYALASGVGAADLYRETVQRMGLFADTMPAAPGVTAEQASHMRWIMDIWRRIFLGIWAATLVLIVTFYGLLIRGWLAAARVLDLQRPALLSRWRMPFPFVAVFIALSTVVLAAGGTARYAAINALLPLGAMYGIQGIVVTGHMLTRWAVPPLFRAVLLAMGILAFPLMILIGVALMGLFDTWIDFRKRWPAAPAAPPPEA